MYSLNSIQQNIHEKALAIAERIKNNERDIIAILTQVEKHKVHFALGFSSVFQYCVLSLKLSESQSYNYIGIARKSFVVPELKKAIDDGKITISNARRIVSVITPENKSAWIEKAATLSQKALEFEVVKDNPKAATRESIKPIHEDRCELKTFISRKLEQDLRRLQDVLSQKLKTHVTLEKAIEFMTSECLDKHDPVKKAERNVTKSQITQSSNDQLCLRVVEKTKVRKPIPAQVKHQVVLRDQNQCTHEYIKGKRCPQKRWTHIHHVKPVAEGGQNEVNNLQTLCFYHHRQDHR